MSFLNFLSEVGISGFLDIAFMSVLIYSILVWFKRTRAAFVVIGMFMIGAAYLLARQLELSLTTTVFQGFFTIIIIAVVIIFQEEIKHFLEQLASRSMARNLRGEKLRPTTRREIDVLVQSCSLMAREKIGALVVVQGKDPVVRHTHGGVSLDGDLSEALLRSLFDPHSPGHDGAVIVTGSRIMEFSAHLPLSKNVRKLQRRGTRHAAGLGLAELTDALCIVVSEERGTISVARNGDLRIMKDPTELRSMLEKHIQEISPPAHHKPWVEFFRRNYKEKAIAIAATVILWFFFVYGAKTDFRTFTVPIQCNDLPENMELVEVDPPEAEVTFSGSRRALFLVSNNDVRVELSLDDIRRGTRTRPISRSNVNLPEGLVLENVLPSEVRVTVKLADR